MIACLGYALQAHGYEGQKNPGSYAPSSVYDPSSNRFLMVFTDIDEFSVPAIYGIFVRPDASPEGTPFRVSGKEALISADARPTVSLDTEKGMFLIAWHDWRSGNPDVYASILNASGHAEVTDLPIANGAFDERYPVADFSPEAGNFIVAWEDARSGDLDIYTSALTLENRATVEAVVKGPARAAYKAPGDQTGASIAYYNEEALGAYYLIAFEDLSGGESEPSISGQIINALTGKTLLPVTLGLDISGSQGGHRPSVTSTASELIPFMVAWHGQFGELRARYMDTTGSAQPPFDMVFEPEGALGAAGNVKVSADKSTGRSALFWQEYAGGQHDIYTSFIEPGDTSGSVYHVMQVAGEEDRDEINLDVSFNSLMPSFLVAYESTDYLTSFNILLTSVTDPDYPEISVQDPVYPFEDLSVEYPGVLFNSAISHTLSVYNDSPYSVLNIMDINSTGPFTVAGENCTLGSLPPSGEPCSITVEFSPGARGPLSGSLSILSDDPNEPSSLLHLSGNSLAPSIEITDTSMPADDMVLDFGTVRIGDTSEGTVTVRNVGDHVLSLGIVRDTSSKGFAIAEDNCSLQALRPSAHCTVVLSASPVYEGSGTGGIWVISDDPEAGEVLVKLMAEGASPLMETEGTGNMVFGSVPSGQSSETEIVVRNTGGVPLTIESIDTTGKAFSVKSVECEGAALGPEDSCTISVSFMPDDTLSYTGSIIINSDSPESPVTTLSLSGYGAVPIAAVHAEGAGGKTMNFEGIEAGRAFTRSLRLTNIGSAPLVPGSPSLRGSGFSMAFDGCSGKHLPYAASCEVLVRFSPSNAGEHTGQLIIPTNDPVEGDIPVALLGTGN
jgi:hypothetical protein